MFPAQEFREWRVLGGHLDLIASWLRLRNGLMRTDGDLAASICPRMDSTSLPGPESF